LLLQLVHISFFAMKKRNILENKSLSTSHLLTLPKK